jgi:hypothetical protein
MTLETGTKYDRSTIKFTGWTAPDERNCTPDAVEGYQPDYYFTANGTYKGPDEYGVEPTWENAE